MKLIFLGTAGDSLTLSKQRRRGGGFILKGEAGQYHIDPGPGSLSSAINAKISPRETICVLVSNNSILASSGLNEVLDAMTLGGLDPFGVVVGSSSVINGTDDEHAILRNQVRKWVERVVTFEETTRVGINYLNIYPIKTKCLDKTGLGFRFETATLTVGYTGETDYFDGLVKHLEGAEVIIVNCKHPLGVREKGAMNIDDIITLGKKIKPRLLVMTGFGNRILEQDIIALTREIHKETGVEVVAAKDGMEIDLDAFAGNQKTLKGYED